MRFTSLINLEENLLHTGNNGEYTLTKIAIPVKGEELILSGILTTPRNRSKYYYAVEHPKQRVVLHFTAGQLRSDLSALTRDNYHVSVAFVIGRDGTVYQLFSSKYWSGHLGKGIGNTNTGNAQDKCTIGIEISNYGYLTERSGNLETYYSRQRDAQGQEGPVDVYCSLTEKQAWFKTDSPLPAALAARARVTGRIVHLPLSAAGELEATLKTLREAGVQLADVEMRKADLEEVFLRLMAGQGMGQSMAAGDAA